MEKLQHDKVVELSIKFDEDLEGMFLDTAYKCGVSNPEGFVKELYKDINPIIFFSLISFLSLNKFHILKITH